MAFSLMRIKMYWNIKKETTWETLVQMDGERDLWCTERKNWT